MPPKLKGGIKSIGLTINRENMERKKVFKTKRTLSSFDLKKM